MSTVSIDHTKTSAAPITVWQLGKHIPQLDGVRGLAILAVTLYRFTRDLPTDTMAGKYLHAFFSLGDRGVELFFVLSGFLITGILVDAKGNKNYFSHFFVRRSLRIFPLYFGALFLFVIFFQWINPSQFTLAREHQFYLWTYLTNVKMSLDNAWCFGDLDHFWSLAVEEHFYLCWPFVIFFCSHRTILRIAVAGAVLSAFSRVLFCVVSDNGVAPDVLTVFRCDALLIGSIIALMIRTEDGIKYLKLAGWPLFAASLVISLACAMVSTRLLTVGHTLWPLLWASLLVGVLFSGPGHLLAQLFAFPFLQRLGKYSYAMYVFQKPLIPLTAGWMSAQQLGQVAGNDLAGHLLYLVAMFGLTYAVAIVSWYAVERHFLKLKGLFPSRGRVVPAVAPELVAR